MGKCHRTAGGARRTNRVPRIGTREFAANRIASFGILCCMQRIATLGLTLAALAALGAASAGPGYRFELWPLPTAFTMLRWSAYAGIAAAVLSFIGALLVVRRRRWRWRSLPTALAAIALGGAIAAVPYSHLRIARSVPPIHDITTDLEQPPPFVDILPLRADAPNPASHGGEAIAEQQRRGYPHLGPLMLEADGEQVFSHALATARDLGWKIVAAVPEDGRIEATDRTYWFGFADDVVVRIAAANGGSRVDVRSVSRVGRSDAGANARRIERFLERLREARAGS